MPEKQTRSSYWDNVKLLLIFLVVLGHYFGYGFVYGDLSEGRWTFPNAVYGFIYMFHMPLFAFVSGYFSKNVEKCREQAVRQYLMPYVVFNTICVVLNRLLLQVPLTNPIFEPYNHMWYLFALFVWRITAKDMQRLRWNWGIMLGVALICSVLSPCMDWNLVSRTILFWPFFLLGLNLGEQQVMGVKKLPHWLCGGVLLGMLLLGWGILEKFDCSTYRLCFLARSFSLDIEGLKGLFKLILRYLTAFGLGICVLNLVPERRFKVTERGRNTMSVYLLHSLPKLRNLMNAWNPLMGNVYFSFAWYTVWSVLAVAIFGCRYVNRWVNAFLDWIARVLTKKPAQN